MQDEQSLFFSLQMRVC